MPKSFTIETPKRSEGWAKFQAWNRKWNRIMATIFCILCFILLFAIVIVNVMETQYDVPPVDLEEFNAVETEDGFIIRQSKVGNICQYSDTSALHSVSCSSGNISSINGDIEIALVGFVCDEIRLIIRSYESTEIPQNWLNKFQCTVSQLSFTSGEISTIAPCAFAGDALTELAVLELIDLAKLKVLTEFTFYGLDSLTHLVMRNLGLTQIESGVMLPFRYDLQVLEFVQMRIDVKNITGDVPISPLLVDLKSNRFGTSLNGNSFKGLTNVISLFLHNSKIERLASDTFQPIANTIKLIHLDNNTLMNIPEGLFTNIVTKSQITLALGGNDWLCDCGSMVEFQKLLQEYPDKFKGNLTCYAPYDLVGVQIANASIDCTDDQTTTVASVVTTPIEVPDTTLPEIPAPELRSVQLACKDYQSYGNKIEPTPPYIVKSSSSEFTICEDASEKIYVEFNRTCSDTALIWYHNSSRFDNTQNLSSLHEYYDCIENYDKHIEIPDIEYNINYIFCIISRDATTVSPFDCAPYLRFKAKPPLDNSTFLYDDQKVLAIVVFVASIISAVIFGGFMALCVLRWSTPRPGPFIKTNDVVDYSGYHIPAIYMTPTPTRMPLSSDRPSLERRFSETSIDSQRSYISANTPTPLELLSWRMEKHRRQSSKIIDPVYLERLPNDPPPLPPHPNRRSKDSTASSSSNQSTTSTDPLCSISLRLERESCYNNNSYA